LKKILIKVLLSLIAWGTRNVVHVLN
jgi:hypothetical protein